VLQQPAFDPATATRTFTVITPDIGETVFIPKILAYAQAHAPRIAIRSMAISSEGAGEALELGLADLAIGYFPDLARPGFYQQRLVKNTFVCMARTDHPRIRGSLTAEAFLRESHAIVRPAGRTHLFEQFLNSKNIKLDVRAELSHFASLLTIISGSNLIATVPRDIGHVFATLAKVQLLDPPLQPPSFHLMQHWHTVAHAADGQDAVRGLTGPPSRSCRFGRHGTARRAAPRTFLPGLPHFFPRPENVACLHAREATMYHSRHGIVATPTTDGFACSRFRPAGT